MFAEKLVHVKQLHIYLPFPSDRYRQVPVRVSVVGHTLRILLHVRGLLFGRAVV
jgi:hypothetical protein